MAVKAVIDTNVWVSSLLNPFGFPARLRKSFENGDFHAVISDHILEEIADVLNRPRIKEKYRINDTDIKELLVLIEERSQYVLLSGDITICRDIDDNLIIETAIKGQAEFLVTRDDDIKSDAPVSSFLSQFKISVVSVNKFLKRLKNV
ncbi:MAG TPA: putative toxin-antitoxin system toxin component, PIN family [Candidatus Wunengus sp. YC63]|uniref:putative toxin-antitoxin system toxin component, PIN family n=1 Tax=unclassified Candidatus Wunengus TaxID=3367695 RepID=UPI002714092D|nr:putative toxin-antitoxin system toxin component, PIN family [Candidatus Brocadiales bacterium]